MPDLELRVGGERHQGWKGVTIAMGLEQGASNFSLTLTDRWTRTGAPKAVKLGASTDLLLDGERLIRGHVDDVVPDYDDVQHSVQVRGRSLLGDLVDCSGKARQFKGQTLEQVARALCKPFGIGVRNLAGAGTPFRDLRIEAGEPFWEFLEQAARIRAVRLVDDAAGNLVITRAGTARIGTPLVLGENIRRGTGEFSHRDVFSEYRVQAQQPGSDTFGLGDAAHAEAVARDQRIRYRPTLRLAEDAASTADCRRRAEWERNTRYGRGLRVTYTVGGWHHADGVWLPNRLVSVRDGYLGLDRDLLIVSVRLIQDGQGRRTELELAPRDSFELVPLPEPGDEGGNWLGGGN